jgi:hypothetical protein
MENTVVAVLKKRLNTFKSDKGVIRNVSSDVVMDVLRAWENWPGKAAELYRDLGLSKMQMVVMIQKAKRLVKSGAIVEGEFKEIAVNTASGILGAPPCNGIELSWEHGKVIRFPHVEQLIDFLKKVA